MHIFEKEFGFILEKAKSISKAPRVVVAGADAENIVRAVFAAAADGFAYPVLVGNKEKILAVLKKYELDTKEYQICEVDEGENVVQHAIDIINAGMGEVLLRGNTSTRDFLMTVLNKANKLVKNEVISEVAMLKIPYCEKIITLSDVSVMIQPSIEKRKQVIKNMVEVLNNLGIVRPKVAVMALVEKPSFHMRDTVEAQTIVSDHLYEPIADCELAGPIPWDLIVSKEAARLKNYDCPYCGEFDAVLMPDVMTGNTLMKAFIMSENVNSCGLLAGARIPIAVTSRSNGLEHAYLSLAACAALLNKSQ